MTAREIEARLATWEQLREKAETTRAWLRQRESEGADTTSDLWKRIVALSAELDAGVALLEADPTVQMLRARAN